MTAAVRVAKTLLDEHADIPREAVTTVVAQLMEAEISGSTPNSLPCYPRTSIPAGRMANSTCS